MWKTLRCGFLRFPSLSPHTSINWWIDEWREKFISQFINFFPSSSVPSSPRVPNTHCNACLAHCMKTLKKRSSSWTWSWWSSWPSWSLEPHENLNHFILQHQIFGRVLSKVKSHILSFDVVLTSVTFHHYLLGLSHQQPGRRRYITCNDWYSNCVISIATKIVQNFLQHFVSEPVLFTLSGTLTDFWSYRKNRRL